MCTYCYIHFQNPYVAEPCRLVDFYQCLERNSGKRGIRIQRLHISLRVTITLGSIGLVRDLPHSLSILRGESNLPSVNILLEVLHVFDLLAKVPG